MAIKINGNTVIADNQAFTTTSTISATGNITGGNLSVIGTVTAAGINTGSSPISTTGNVTGGNILTGGVVSATGNITGSFIIGNGSQLTGLPAGYSNTDAAAFLAAFGSNTILTSGNITGGNIIGTIVGNVSTATISASGNVTGGNLLTGGLISATGTVTSAANVIGGNLSTAGSLFVADGIAPATPLTTITGGIISAAGNVTGGNLLTAGQISATGNITGSNLTLNGNAVITGNLSVSGTETIFNVANLTVNDKDIIVANNVTGSANVDGAGIQAGNPGVATWFYNNATLSWQSNVGITPTTNGVLNLGGASNFWGNAFLTTASVTGNVQGGNIRTAGLISATGNITGGNITTAGRLFVTAGTDNIELLNGVISASGNVQAGNIRTAGLISATGNITGGNVSATNLTGTLLTAAQTNITSVGTLSALSVTGNVQGGNIRTAGLVSATGAITGGALTGTSLTVSTGNVSCGNIVNTNANGVGNIGSTGTRFNQVFALASSAQYADLAEKYTADADYAPGTVLVFGGTAEVTADAADSDSRVAGVVSTNPAYIMNDGLSATFVAAVALTGRVPCLVTGSVRKGDLMVTAGNGAARSAADPRVGTVIGKALENHDGESGTIEVVVGRF